MPPANARAKGKIADEMLTVKYPINVPITFDYEVENKYGIKMKKLLLRDINHTLPDGRKWAAL